jgi:outer membrane protein assembly factor BamB
MRTSWIGIGMIASAVLFLSSRASSADNWPGFRGPTGLGYTQEKDLPLTWDGKKGEAIPA